MGTGEHESLGTGLPAAALTVGRLYDEVTDNCTQPLRLDDLLYEAAERVPGLVPTRAEVEVERQRKLADKTGVELAQGLLASEILAKARIGRHLVESMLRPTPLAEQHLDELRRAGRVDL